jgi:hypothetical protein
MEFVSVKVRSGMNAMQQGTLQKDNRVRNSL